MSATRSHPTTDPTTTSTATTATATATAPSRGAAGPRRLLQVDAALCAGLGLPLALAADPVADLLGTTSATLLRWVGVALVVYALDLLLLARSRWARPAVLAAGAGSVLWELGSLVVAALADLSTVGTVLVVGQGLAVGTLGVLQLRAGRR